MKKFIAILLGLFIFSSMCIAQDSTQIVFGGGRYDKMPLLSVGYAAKLTGNLWNFSYMDVGQTQSVNVEVAYMIGIPKSLWIIDKFYFGPIAGPNAEWYGGNAEDEVPVVNYIVGAAGGLIAADITPNWGAWGYGKYKFSFEDTNMYKDGYAIGAGLFYRF